MQHIQQDKPLKKTFIQMDFLKNIFPIKHNDVVLFGPHTLFG